ncbi:double-strand break repair protein AddB [uncultured Brevundimonas sp.]|uniref:double-strand break repair protein AddB n=1 Tax=uncultured Brevundimonas sp. TaxID=213418 RepID=UPI002638731C|nr:double-strand break repair protein AddB [uncultured Brevundimonas sp.]
MGEGVFDPFSGGTPRWYTIAAHRPFLEDLAAGVLSWLGGRPPEELSDATILLPNRRAARAFTAALSKLSGDKPVLLPQVRPLGDLEDDEPPFTPGALGMDLAPAIPSLTRRFELARMIVESYDPSLTPVQALDMADALGRFLDSCQLEEVQDPSVIGSLVDGDMAVHWQKSAKFLSIGVEQWPRRLEELGLVDPAWRRAKLLRRLAEHWSESPPQNPVIVAGSTGTVPAAADVLGAVARAPMGCVVLPGLDFHLEEKVWQQIDADNEQHPQRALKRLLERHDIAREAVRPWFRPALTAEAERKGQARQRLLNEALRPADATGDWRQAIDDIRAAAGTDHDPIAEGTHGLKTLTLKHEEEAAAAIALMMRQTLETPGKTCALVTPDQALGRRVQARLQRWGIVADASAGEPLNRMPAGILMGLCARWMVEPVNPQTLLGILKHPLTVMGDATTPQNVRELERYGLRTSAHASFAALRQHLDRALDRSGLSDEARAAIVERNGRLNGFIDTLEALIGQAKADFDDEGMVALNLAAEGLTRLMEALAGQQAWAGPDGEQAAAILTGLIGGGAALGRIDATQFSELVDSLLAETVVRTGGATHPSLRILGAIEARLVRADLMILAGLEEGIWPQGAPVDPFLSRPMRAKLGLPPPERRIGQSAQDFVQAACSDEAILVHCERRGGQPAVASRWLWRLEMLTSGANNESHPVKLEPLGDITEWTRAMDAPLTATPQYARRPAPTPPVDRRPRELPVTSIERWVRDPYALYAERILGLRKLDRPGEPAEALKRGTAIHAAIERMTKTWPRELPEDLEAQLADLIQEELRQQGFNEAAMAREVPLSHRMAQFLGHFERTRRQRGIVILVEQSGRLTFDAPGGPFTVTAKADRIERCHGEASVIDFKTGTPPSATQVRTGFAPQLPLTAAILAGGGFDIAATPDQLLYVRVGGGKGGEEKDVSKPAAATLASDELDRLKEAVALYDEEAKAYPSWEAPQYMGNFGGNYDHLARVWEWFVVGGENGEEA